MDFVLTETEVESNDFKLVFSDDDEEEEEMESCDSLTAEDEMFIDDSDQDKEEDISFYRSFENRKECP